MAKRPDTGVEENSAGSADRSPAKDPPTKPASTETDWFSALLKDDNDSMMKAISARLNEILVEHNVGNYHPLFLIDPVDSISRFHSDKLYAAASNVPADNDIMLFIDSRGGSIEPAYLISKTLKRLSKNKFVVVVPRSAKSAGTLIALGADEIHMGLVSQLGPIDPQVGGLPALALGNALDVIVDLACRFPESSDLLSKYLNQQTSMRMIGYYQRVNESAVQYAERLLAGKNLGKNSSNFIANHLVNHYKDHGFVIDVDETRELLGAAVVKESSDEYRAGDEIYKFYDFVSFVLRRRKNLECWIVGDAHSGFETREMEDDQK